MVRNIEAIYENGVLRPLTPLRDLAENARVSLTILEAPPHPAMKHSYGILSHEAADEMLKIIDDEFGKVNPDDWR